MQNKFRLLALCSVLTFLTLAAGCATAPAGARKDPRDPLERINRTTWKFDDALAHDVAIPVGHAYTKVTPTFVRRGIANVFENAHTPVVMVNDLLQARFLALGQETARLLLNSTVGIGGLLDPASAAGLPKDENDFGRTLGTWGVHSGPYLVLPLFGPSDIRDGVGKIPDAFLNPQNYISGTAWIWGIYGVTLLNISTETIIPTYQLLDQQNAFDRYAFARNAYLQQREFLIHGDSGGVDKEELELQKSLQDDDSGAAPPARGSPPVKAQ
jgi:phospholipid-binding lipoprotein MlaA